MQAHIELAKAEASVVGGRLAVAAGLVGMAIAVAILAALLLFMGTALFLGEWLFGSMGWGILHGVLLFVGVAVAAGLMVAAVEPSRIARSAFVALLFGVVAALVFGLRMPNQLYTIIGENFLPNVEPGVRPLVVGLAIWAVVGLLLGIGLALRPRKDATAPGPSASSRAATILGLGLAGAAFGAFTAISFSPQVGIALGIAVVYAAWIALMLADVARTGIDTEAIKARYTPSQTIETSKETLEWLKTRLPPGTAS